MVYPPLFNKSAHFSPNSQRTSRGFAKTQVLSRSIYFLRSLLPFRHCHIILLSLCISKMQSSLSLSFSPTSSAPSVYRSHHSASHCFPVANNGRPLNLRFCGLRREALGFTHLKLSDGNQRVSIPTRTHLKKVSAALSYNGSAPKSFDYDLLIIGAGVGGHGAALHAVEKVTSMPCLSFISCLCLIESCFVVNWNFELRSCNKMTYLSFNF